MIPLKPHGGPWDSEAQPVRAGHAGRGWLGVCRLRRRGHMLSRWKPLEGSSWGRSRRGPAAALCAAPPGDCVPVATMTDSQCRREAGPTAGAEQLRPTPLGHGKEAGCARGRGGLAGGGSGRPGGVLRPRPSLGAPAPCEPHSAPRPS